MSEKIEVSIIEVKEEKEGLKLTVAPEDFSAVYEVNLFKQSYDRKEKKWHDDQEQYDQFIQNMKDFFEIELDVDPLADLEKALINRKIELYKRSETKLSFFEGIDIEKPANDLIGDIEKVTIERVDVYDAMARIIFKWVDGKYYAQNFRFGKWLDSLEKTIPNPAKRIKSEERFKKLTGVGFDDAQSLVGKEVQVEIVENSFKPNEEGLCEMKRIKK